MTNRWSALDCLAVAIRACNGADGVEAVAQALDALARVIGSGEPVDAASAALLADAGSWLWRQHGAPLRDQVRAVPPPPYAPAPCAHTATCVRYARLPTRGGQVASLIRGGAFDVADGVAPSALELQRLVAYLRLVRSVVRALAAGRCPDALLVVRLWLDCAAGTEAGPCGQFEQRLRDIAAGACAHHTQVPILFAVLACHTERARVCFAAQ